jgi:Phosphoesterase family
MRMKPARPSRRKFLGSVAGGAALTGVNSVLAKLASAAPGASSLSGVEHVVIFMQENRSFDHYLGTLNGVRGYGDRRALERKPGASVFGQASGNKLIYPYRLDNSATSGQCVGDVAHDWATGLAATNGGRMDGWVPAKGPSTMSCWLARRFRRLRRSSRRRRCPSTPTPDGSNLGTETLGGPYAAERVGTTALLANKPDGKLPVATRSIDVHLVTTRASGTDDDGYADNLVLTLHN